MAIRLIARQDGDIGWADTERPLAVRSVNPLAYIHRAAELIFDLHEAPGFGTGRSVKHDIHKHDFIMQRWPAGGNGCGEGLA